MLTLRQDLHALTGAYTLDALDDEAERERFDRHLRRCQACAGEVRGMREVATAMALAAAADAPAELRDRVLAAVDRTRQLPPETARRNRTRTRIRISSWLSWPWMPRLAVATACVVVVIAVVLGVVLINTSGQLSRERARNTAIAAVLAAPDLRVLSSPVTGGGLATVEVSPARRELVVSTTSLPPLPAGKVYQLWLIGTSATRSAGLLPLAIAGRAGPVLASGLLAGDKLGMTVEPAGGTAQPTTTPVLALSLSA